MAKNTNELPEAIMEHLRQPNVVIVGTISVEGLPNLDLLSWVWPMDPKTVRMVISPNFPGGINMAANGRAVLQIIDDQLTYEIQGTATLVKERCESVRFPQTMYDLVVEQVRENMFPATHLTSAILFARDEGTEALHKDLDEGMYAEILSTPVRAGG